MNIAIETETDCKKLKGILIETVPFRRDIYTGQSTGPDYKLDRDSLVVQILDDDAGRFIDVSEKYKLNPGLLEHCEMLLIGAQTKRAV